MERLEQWKGEAVRYIGEVVDRIQQEIRQKGSNSIEEYQKQLEVANGIMQLQADRLEKMASQVKSIEDFDAIKLVYFKDDTELYFEEVDEAIKEFKAA